MEKDTGERAEMYCNPTQTDGWNLSSMLLPADPSWLQAGTTCCCLCFSFILDWEAQGALFIDQRLKLRP